MLKKTLTQAIFAQVGRYQNPIVDYYSFKKKEKCTGKATVAAARKLVTVIYIMLKYNKEYWFVEESLYFRKLKQCNLELVS